MGGGLSLETALEWAPYQSGNVEAAWVSLLNFKDLTLAGEGSPGCVFLVKLPECGNYDLKLAARSLLGIFLLKKDYMFKGKAEKPGFFSFSA